MESHRNACPVARTIHRTVAGLSASRAASPPTRYSANAIGTTKAACATSQHSTSALTLVGKPAPRNTVLSLASRAAVAPAGSPSIVFCWRISTYRITGPSRTPPAAGNPNRVRSPSAAVSSAVRPTALPKNSTSGWPGSSGSVPGSWSRRTATSTRS
jgi:hypothetical protein